ncbi:hypothetical protein Nm8I071_44460 [Nonomuraea sp. TT08I-71]|nr:hypothetical protein Nm8I071_44460 [Nonomuraea sp. TT08I-71]
MQLGTDLPADHHPVPAHLVELQAQQGDEAPGQIRLLHGDPSLSRDAAASLVAAPERQTRYGPGPVMGENR